MDLSCVRFSFRFTSFALHMVAPFRENVDRSFLAQTAQQGGKVSAGGRARAVLPVPMEGNAFFSQKRISFHWDTLSGSP
ncbi:hypothetical protein [Lawsonibacter hominis]|jgi:hypothetical protein|uniref:Uncharacterized protein n=1 Tax=Lawsonibacter hominis TaxID=2763053 RepID=A0A8J6MEM4_9FIRM|nr:hypothetical protein [Lawsonibacter hominis]MBC5733128.1 hypothetical protein [Lawsonibacter hominis]MCI6398211.1 hypothetical protein [Lawsonibacter sp.]